MSDERRQSKRYELSMDLPVFIVNKAQPLGYLADITTAGLLLQSEQLIRLQREYALEIRLHAHNAMRFYNDGESKYVHFHAFSLWQTHDGSMYRTGFRICDISPSANLSLSYLIRKFHKKDDKHSVG
jgi:hypothetical protein